MAVYLFATQLPNYLQLIVMTYFPEKVPFKYYRTLTKHLIAHEFWQTYLRKFMPLFCLPR